MIASSDDSSSARTTVLPLYSRAWAWAWAFRCSGTGSVLAPFPSLRALKRERESALDHLWPNFRQSNKYPVWEI